MKFSRNWLGEYVELPEAVEELARRLTAAGHSVELVEEAGEDFVLDVDVTTNRPDCMNHLGLAREIAVLYGRPLRPPAAELAEASEKAAAAIRIEIDAPDLCRRYVGRVIRGVTVGPSPGWLRKRLEAIGLRSIDVVVDVTNYVLWETGQPLHAFDLQRIAGAALRVRRAAEGEKLVTLDGAERELTPEMLVIADGEGPVALAGVMGGLHSEVTGATRDVLLESAFFEPAAVRRTAGGLGLHTDASHRFERGADPGAPAWAARRAAALITELAGGAVLQGDVDVHPRPWTPTRIPLEHGRLEAFMGIPLQRQKVEGWLGALGFELEPAGDGRWEVAAPSWRWNDVGLPADLYEEVIRVHGFDGIPATLPRLAGADPGSSAVSRAADHLRSHLAACGYSEAITFAFHDAGSDGVFPGLYGGAEALKLANPLSERYAVMRRSLLPNLLESARFNQRRGAAAVRLFEIGHAFAGSAPEADEEGVAVAGAQEKEVLALVAGGRVAGPWEVARELDFFDLKGALESLGAGIPEELSFRPRELPWLLAGCSAEILSGGRVVGYCGRLESDEGPYPLFVAELATAGISHAAAGGIEVPSRFPGIAVDLTLTHSRDVPWSDIHQAVGELAPPDLDGWGLEARYTGEGVPDGAVNTTIHFLYISGERSLTQEEVNQRHGELSAALDRRFGWRSSRGEA